MKFIAALVMIILSISYVSAQGIGQSGISGQAPTVPKTSGGISGGGIFSVDDYGAVGNGTTDDSPAFFAAATACAVTGGTITIGPKQYLINSSNFTIPAYCTVTGGWHWPGNYNGGQTSYGHIWTALDYAHQPYTIILNPTRSILFSRDSGLTNVSIANKANVIPSSLQTAVNLVNGFSGTALKVGSSPSPIGTGSRIKEVAIWGFNTCVSVTHPSDISEVFGDCTNGFDAGVSAQTGDEVRWHHMQFFPWMTQNQSWSTFASSITNAVDHGDGTIDITLNSPISLANGTQFHGVVTSVGGTIEANGGWTITVNSSTSLNLVGSTFTNAYTAGGTFNLHINYRSGFGFQVATHGCDGCGFSHTFEFAHAIGYHFGQDANYAYCFECNFDSPTQGDTTTIGYLIDANANSITMSGAFQSAKGTGIRVNTTTDMDGRSHHMVAPRISSNTSGSTFTNGDGAYAVDVLVGALTIVGGYIANGVHVGSSATQLQLIGVDAHGTTPVVDNPGAFVVSGGRWPAKITPGGSMENRIVNGDFLISQINANSSVTISGSTYIIDGWKVRGSGLITDFSHQRATTGGVTATAPASGDGANHVYSYVHTVTTPATPTAAQWEYFGNRIEGNQVEDLNWGTATAKTVVLSYWLKSSISGTYSAALTNGLQNRSYVVTCAVTAATWKYCSHVIPGDTTGTWNKNRNQVGIELTLDLGSGTDFQTTVGSWQTGNFYEATGATQLVANAAATLAITGARLRSGTYDTPFIARPFETEFQLARRYYQTSFTLDTRPVTNGGLTGAVCTANPIANGYPSVYIPFNPPMMTTPTVTTYNPSAANANWRDVTNVGDVVVSVNPGTTLGSTGVQINTTATYATVPADLCIHYSANSAL